MIKILKNLLNIKSKTVKEPNTEHPVSLLSKPKYVRTEELEEKVKIELEDYDGIKSFSFESPYQVVFLSLSMFIVSGNPKEIFANNEVEIVFSDRSLITIHFSLFTPNIDDAMIALLKTGIDVTPYLRHKKSLSIPLTLHLFEQWKLIFRGKLSGKIILILEGYKRQIIHR